MLCPIVSPRIHDEISLEQITEKVIAPSSNKYNLFHLSSEKEESSFEAAA